MKGSAKSTPYAEAGVDVCAGDKLARRIAAHARGILDARVLAGVGGFAALYEVPPGYSEPVLVSGADGVGTKLLLALERGKVDSVGVDLVAMCVNDILAHGAEPLFFLDYFACGELDAELAERVVAGVVRGCKIAGCALVGGETAEMPGMYPPGKIDLAGFALGVCEKSELLPRDGIGPGDVLVGLESSGAHSNGYSLLRKWMRDGALDLAERVGGETLEEALLRPTRIYAAAVRAVRERIKGVAHVTGGGFASNLERILPAGARPRLDSAAWPESPLFDLLAERGGLGREQMLEVFNCGIGMVLVASPGEEGPVMDALAEAGEQARRIGVLE